MGTEDRVTYKANVRLLVGGTASGATSNLRQVKYQDPPPPTGLHVINGWVDVPCCGRTGRAIFEYDTPWHPASNYELYWQKQPGTANDFVEVFWNDGSGHRFTARGDLNGDRAIRLTASGVFLTNASAASAMLPTLNFG